MKGLLIFTLGSFLAFQAPERPFPNHEKPPENWFCHPALDNNEMQADAHACDCRGMTMTDPQPTEEQCHKQPTYDDDGNQNGEVLTENARCRVYCWRDHCHCRQRCETT